MGRESMAPGGFPLARQCTPRHAGLPRFPMGRWAIFASAADEPNQLVELADPTIGSESALLGQADSLPDFQGWLE